MSNQIFRNLKTYNDELGKLFKITVDWFIDRHDYPIQIIYVKINPTTIFQILTGGNNTFLNQIYFKKTKTRVKLK